MVHDQAASNTKGLSELTVQEKNALDRQVRQAYEHALNVYAKKYAHTRPNCANMTLKIRDIPNITKYTTEKIDPETTLPAKLCVFTKYLHDKKAHEAIASFLYTTYTPIAKDGAEGNTQSLRITKAAWYSFTFIRNSKQIKWYGTVILPLKIRIE
jgi:hypothetical protein